MIICLPKNQLSVILQQSNDKSVNLIKKNTSRNLISFNYLCHS